VGVAASAGFFSYFAIGLTVEGKDSASRRMGQIEPTIQQQWEPFRAIRRPRLARCGTPPRELVHRQTLQLAATLVVDGPEKQRDHPGTGRTNVT